MCVKRSKRDSTEIWINANGLLLVSTMSTHSCSWLVVTGGRKVRSLKQLAYFTFECMANRHLLYKTIHVALHERFCSPCSSLDSLIISIGFLS